MRIFENDDNALLASDSVSFLFLEEEEERGSWSGGRRALSHSTIRARPWAMLARRATVQGVLASRLLSRVTRFEGLLYAAIR